MDIHKSLNDPCSLNLVSRRQTTIHMTIKDVYVCGLLGITPHQARERLIT